MNIVYFTWNNIFSVESEDCGDYFAHPQLPLNHYSSSFYLHHLLSRLFFFFPSAVNIERPTAFGCKMNFDKS